MLSDEEANQLSSELVHVGTRALVMQATSLGEALRKEKMYSCRYCVLATRQEDQLSSSEAEGTKTHASQNADATPNTSAEEKPDPPIPEDKQGTSSIPEDKQSSSDNGKGKNKDKTKGPKLAFTFDGFRSHAKEK